MYLAAHGNPSGNLLTTLFNTICTLTALLFALYFYCYNELKKTLSLEYLYKEVLAAKGFGDDNVCSWTPEVDGFGYGAIHKYCLRLGYVMSDFKKKILVYDPVTLQAEPNFYHIKDVEFLKRKFREDGPCVFAPLALEHILDMTNWCSKKNELALGTYLSASAAVLELYHHPEDIFHIGRTKINAALIKHNLKPINISYLELYARFVNMGKDTPVTYWMPGYMSDPLALNAGPMAFEKAPVEALIEVSTQGGVSFTPLKSLSKDSKCVLETLTKIAVGPRIKGIKKQSADANAQMACSGNFRQPVKPTIDEGMRREAELDELYPALAHLYADQTRKRGRRHLGSLPPVRPDSGIKKFWTWFKSDLEKSRCTRWTFYFLCFWVSFWATFFIGVAVMPISQLTSQGAVPNQVAHFRPFRITNNAGYRDRSEVFAQMNKGPGYEEFQKDDNPEEKAPPTKEAKTKSSGGIISGIFRAASGIASVISFFPVIGSIASIMSPIFKAGSLVAAYFGYDYPVNISTINQMRIAQTSGFALMKGLDTVDQISCDPANLVSSEHNFFCEKIGPAHNFSLYRLRPAIILHATFNSSNLQNGLIWSLPVLPTYMANNNGVTIFTLHPVGNYASFFRYWRGSMKYMIMFTTSRFVSARIRIEWHPNFSTVGLTTSNDTGDIVSLTVDVNGDTDVPFMVPWLKDTPYLPIVAPDVATTAGDNSTNGWICMTVVNPPVASDTTFSTTIHCIVWMSGGEDFECSRPTELFPGFEFSPVANFPLKKEDKNNNGVGPFRRQRGFDVHAQMSKQATTQSQFMQTFKPLAPCDQTVVKHILQGETVQSFVDLFHRYTKIKQAGVSAQFDKFTSSAWDLNTNNWGQWNQMLCSFLLHRGPIRYKVIQTDSLRNVHSYISNWIFNPLNQLEQYNYPPERLGMTFNDHSFRNTNETEVPFYGIYPFICFMSENERFEWPGMQYTVQTSDNNFSHQYDVYAATGDTYTMGVPIAPGFIGYSSLKAKGKDVKAQMKQDNHGLEERKVVQTEIQESTQLTSFRDTVGVKSESHALISPIHRNTNPYADQGLSQVLSRPYNTHTFPWLGSDALGALIGKGTFPSDLLVPNILAKLDYFKYFRAAVHIEMRLNSTTYHAGRLLIVYCPRWNPSNSFQIMGADDMWSLSCLDNIVLSANANETIAFDIPYVAPSVWWDTSVDPSDGQPTSGIFGYFKIFVLSPLILTGSSGTPALTVSVYSNFVHPECTGFTLNPVAVSKKSKRSGATPGVESFSSQKKASPKSEV